jgi:hypothetical protein
MTQIKVLSTNRFNGYFETLIELRLDIPTILNTLPNKKEIAESYKALYGIDRVENGYIFFTKVCTFNDGSDSAVIQGTFAAIALAYETALAAFPTTLQDIDSMTGNTLVGNAWIYIPPVTPTNTQVP